MSQDLPRRMQMVGVGNGRAVQSPEEIERMIERTREQLAVTIDTLAYRVSPRELARRWTERARLALSDADGHLSRTRLAAIGGVAGAVVALVVWRRVRH